MKVSDLRQFALRYLDTKFQSRKNHRHIFDKIVREQRKNKNFKIAIAVLLLLRCMATSQEQKDKAQIALAHQLSCLPQEAREFVIDVSANLTEFFNSYQIESSIKDLLTVSTYKLTPIDQRSDLQADAYEAFQQLCTYRIGHFFEVGRFGRT